MAGLKSKFPKSTTDTSTLNSSLSSRITDANVQNAINKDTKDAAISALKDLFPPTQGGKKRTRKVKKSKKSKKSKKRLPSKKRKARKSIRKH